VQSSSRITQIWIVTLVLGMTSVSCATQRSRVYPDFIPAITDSQPRTLDSELRTALLLTSQLDSKILQESIPAKTELQVAYAKVPLYFEPNQGPTDEQVSFLSRGRGYALFLTPTEAVLALRRPSNNSFASVPNSLSSPLPWRERIQERGIKSRGPESIEQTVLPLKFDVDANPNQQGIEVGGLKGGTQ
jgi:hypothetical protein